MPPSIPADRRADTAGAGRISLVMPETTSRAADRKNEAASTSYDSMRIVAGPEPGGRFLGDTGNNPTDAARLVNPDAPVGQRHLDSSHSASRTWPPRRATHTPALAL